MTLTLELDLGMVKMYHHPKKEDSMSTVSKVIARTDRQTDTDRHYENTSTAHTGGKRVCLLLGRCAFISFIDANTVEPA